MKGWAIPVAIVAAIVALSSAAFMLYDEEWSIDYDAAGGEMPDSYPTSYREGDDFALPVPTMPGYVFTGWYLSDPEEVLETVAGLSGDVVLHASWREGVVYAIDYSLNGGSFAAGVQPPASYTEGEGSDVPVPNRDGYIFCGWFRDEGFTQPLVVIEADKCGDITLFAKWVADDLVGTGFTWEVHGVYYNGTIRHTMDGTWSYEYTAFSNGVYYCVSINNITYAWPGGSFTDTTEKGSWEAAGSSLEYVSLDVLDGVVCTVWTDGEGTTYWLRDLYIQERIELASGTTRIVYDLVDEYAFEPKQTFYPTVSFAYGLSVDYPGEVRIGDSFTMTATGEGFSGWYVDGVLVTEDRTITVSRADPYRSYRAASSAGYTVIEPGTDPELFFGAGGPVSIEDADGNPVAAGSLVLGLYRMTVSLEGNLSETVEFFVEDRGTFHHVWTYAGKTYTIDVDLLYSDVCRYGYSSPYGDFRGTIETTEYISHYHTAGDPYLVSIVEDLMAMGEGMGRTEFAQFVLSFVQTIPYKTDASTTGSNEFWKYPLETLWDYGGDCEDSSILYGTLMGIAGYDVAFILFQDHAMSAVEVDASGYKVVIDGESYYMCETTSERDIGWTAPGYRPYNALYFCHVEFGDY